MLLEDYLNLITSEHRHRPTYMATVEAVLRPVCGIEELLHDLRTAFDLDTAVGRQLDATGVRIGRARYLYVPLEVYFSWNTEGLGWNEAYWQGQHDPDSGITVMSDDLYRQLLYAKVAANQWDGTIPDAYAVWEIAFANSGSVLFIQDNQDMSFIAGVAGKAPDVGFEQLLLQGYIPLKPEGVRIAWYALPPGGAAGGGPIFAWNCDSDALAGWNIGNWPKKLIPLQDIGGTHAA
jgi:hypothetical protein